VPRHTAHAATLIASILLVCSSLSTANDFNKFGLKFYTMESEHFRFHYQEGLEHFARRAAPVFENLYDIYDSTYSLKLPAKTEVMIVNDIHSNGWAMDLLNVLLISPNGFDYNLRGTSDWLRDVATHEYAHLVSISSSHKGPAWIPYLQLGYFSHPNNTRKTKNGTHGSRVEALHIFPLEILPPWFFEGIAQYEASRRGSDSWDSHRDMILRSLALGDKLLPWDHMFVFAGKGDDFEKTYNHGFSMVKYISETYGYGKIVSILRESSKLTRINFDRSIKAVLGISARTLYSEWKQSLVSKYTAQVKALGTQVYGRKLNKNGFDNYWPRFSPDEKKIYFTSNDKNEYTIRSLYSYSLVDTVKEDKRIKLEMGIKGNYSIHAPSGRIAFASGKSRKSNMPPKLGGYRAMDLFIDTLPPEKKKFSPPWKKTEHQLTFRQNLFGAAFSPAGDRLAAFQYLPETYQLCIVDTSGKHLRVVYPPKGDVAHQIRTMYSVDWSPDGRSIAVSYLDDTGDRKVGVYDTVSRAFSVVCDTKGDERDPRFSRDGAHLYFSSDRTGIFNIYRYSMRDSSLARVTNVSGGAFAPEVNKAETRLVYVNYDKDGYGIYLIDTLRALDTAASADTPREVVRDSVPEAHSTLSISSPRPYSYAPRKFLLTPTMYWEEAVTRDNDPYRGQGVLKVGAIADLLDPFDLAMPKGNELRAYLLLDAGKIGKFIDINRGIFSAAVDYELGAFGSTNMLPLPIQLSYSQRGITGRDRFYDGIEDKIQTLPYNVTPIAADVVVPYYLQRGGSMSGSKDGSAGLFAFASVNKTDVTMLTRDLYGKDFKYNIQKGGRVGAFLAATSINPSPTSYINPTGFYAKLLYNYEQQLLIDDENSFGTDGKENYDTYSFNRVKANLRGGIGMPWSAKNVLYFDLGGSLTDLRSVRGTTSKDFPYYYEPEIWWHPGYAYYERGTAMVTKSIVRPNETTPVDTQIPQSYYKGVVAGNAVTFGTVSFRFPMWKGSIDKKLSFLYLDRLYGTVNFSGGAGWKNPHDVVDVSAPKYWDNWLPSMGAEIRLEGQTFSRYPLALRLKWDYGWAREAPVGGNRFMLGIGFSFDGWELIEIPDYIHGSGRGAAQ